MKTPFLCQARRLFVLALLPFVAATASESPSLLLEKGIYAEEVEQNLDSAIKIYTQISAEAAANRSVVAQAQYRLAVCYQKQGKKEEAIRVLNELVQSPSDLATVTKAREALGTLGAPTSEEVTIRKVTFPVASDWFISLSEDGRFLAYKPVGTRDLAVCELATAKSWIVSKATEDSWVRGYAMISPDGKWIAYDQNDYSAIVVSKIDGSETHALWERKSSDESGLVWGWSSDSLQAFVGVQTQTVPRAILAVELKTGAKREIARLPKPNTNGAAWSEISSDGKYVAYRVGSYPRTIVLADLVSGREEVIVDRDAGDFVLFADNDTRLLFSKRGDRGNELWSIAIKEGKPVGQAQLLRSNLGGIKPFGVTRDNAFYYRSSWKNNADNIWVMEGLFIMPKANPVMLGPEIRRMS